MTTISPTALTLRELRRQGWTSDVVERRQAGILHDYLGMVDIIAVRGAETLAIQATSHNGGNMAARVHKIKLSPHLGKLTAAGWRVEVWGWHKPDRLWTCRIVRCETATLCNDVLHGTTQD